MSNFNTAGEVAQEIALRLGRISQANGYETDIGLSLFLGRKKIEDEMVPCAVLIEGDDTVRDRAGRTPGAHIAQRYVLVGYDRCDPDNPNTKAHEIIRDFKRSIFRTGDSDDLASTVPDSTFGRKVVNVRYLGRDIGPRTDGANIVMALIEISVEFAEDLSNP